MKPVSISMEDGWAGLDRISLMDLYFRYSDSSWTSVFAKFDLRVLDQKKDVESELITFDFR